MTQNWKLGHWPEVWNEYMKIVTLVRHQEIWWNDYRNYNLPLNVIDDFVIFDCRILLFGLPSVLSLLMVYLVMYQVILEYHDGVGTVLNVLQYFKSPFPHCGLLIPFEQKAFSLKKVPITSIDLNVFQLSKWVKHQQCKLGVFCS